jgi:hypothetical protein
VSRRSPWLAAFWLSAALQCLALYSPSAPAGPSGLPVDKVAHVLLFGAVAALGVVAGIPRRWLAVGLLAQAVASELVQGALLDQRGADPWDFAADLVGVAAGLWAGGWLARRQAAAPD